MIVDADADLDETIMYSIYSAFGFQGQKCSALSRLILLNENYDRVMERLIPVAASSANRKSGATRRPCRPGYR